VCMNVCVCFDFLFLIATVCDSSGGCVCTCVCVWEIFKFFISMCNTVLQHVCVCECVCVCVWNVLLKISFFVTKQHVCVCVFCDRLKFVGFMHLSLHCTVCVECVCVCVKIHVCVCGCECVYFVDSSKVGGVWIFHTLHIHACVYLFVYIYICMRTCLYEYMQIHHDYEKHIEFLVEMSSVYFSQHVCFAVFINYFLNLLAWQPGSDSCSGSSSAQGPSQHLHQEFLARYAAFLFVFAFRA
jgi:hypothetical protein